MRHYTKVIITILKLRGKKILLFPYDILRYFIGYLILSKTNKRADFSIKGFLPMLADRHEEAGTIDRHYFLQDIYVAQKVSENKPEKHYDIGSRLDGFIANLICKNVEVTMIDIRPLNITVNGLKFKQDDATTLLSFEDESVNSLSSLHAIEHFGLGRYGDCIDVEGCFKAMKTMERVLKPNGMLYLSVPISKSNGIVYNSHRVFSPITIIESLNALELIEFSYIKDYRVTTLKGTDAMNSIKKNDIDLGEYDLGIFIMRK